VRLAGVYGFEESCGLLPVEQFMREYFEHTSNVRYISSNFLATAKGRSSIVVFFGNLFSRSDGREYRIGPRRIRATKLGLEKLQGNFAEILRLMVLANLLNRWIDHDTWQAIRIDMMTRKQVPLTPLAIERFLALLAQPTRLAELLRRLHQLRDALPPQFIYGDAHHLTQSGVRHTDQPFPADQRDSIPEAVE
ncbi:MAG: hypothetical protein ABGX07_00450, partial [Pirellulaceae bacterium]